MDRDYNLDRFVDAQKFDYSYALEEMRNGRKTSHWMWYIFPQLKHLGRSTVAEYYGIEDLEEARAYLSHPILGERLKEISEVLLSIESNDPYEVMGSVDGLKLRSSMTLFAEVEGNGSVFEKVIDKFYGGNKDEYTLRILRENTK